MLIFVLQTYRFSLSDEPGGMEGHGRIDWVWVAEWVWEDKMFRGCPACLVDRRLVREDESWTTEKAGQICSIPLSIMNDECYEIWNTGEKELYL